ncbi:ran-binding protein 21 [Naegleria gruberi]|uniref:Ran-binding protein 21 n=1 Tax=Naegleria gruberi TaxID=5762 RepID=D2UXD0_NAEGR|nr:ran-binding protein 21 [Naegleria gruberi]EFC50263.1 ran-binding protein 21 [Naegleria gruberi]|eukprot:XP_002683007.1 ran-binding protein 21 [Naegleria gruberi strain NEG-M]
MNNNQQQQDQIFQNLLQAIHIIHNSSSPQQQRLEAQQFVENFKTNQPNKIDFCWTFINNNQPEEVRHFGLQIIHHIVSREWPTIPSTYQSTQAKIKVAQTLLDYAASGTKHMLEEKSFIKEKLASILSIITELTWPSVIPDMLENIVKLTGMGETQREIAIITLRSLAQDLTSDFATDMPPNKRRDLIEKLQPKIPDIFTMAFQLFDTSFGIYKSKNDQKSYTINQKLLRSLIDMSMAFVSDWLDPAHFFNHNIIDIWISLMHVEEFKMDSSHCLTEFVDVSWGSKKELNMANHMSILLAKLCENARIILGKANPDNLEDEYEFHKVLSKLFVAFSQKQLKYLSEKHTEIVDNFLTVVLEFDKHPSLVIFNDTLVIWNGIFSNPKLPFCNAPFLAKYFEPLLQVTRLKITKEIGNPDVERFESNLTHQLCLIDFEDKKEYYQLHGSMRSQARSLVQHITHRVPFDSVKFATLQVTEALKTNAPNPKDDKGPNGYCSVFSDAYLLWESSTTFYEWVIESVSNDKASGDERIIEAEMYLLDICLKFSTDDPLIQTVFVRLFKSFSHLNRRNKNSLMAIAENLFKQMQFRPSKEVGKAVEDLTEDTSSARQKAHTTFISLCQSNAKDLPQFLKEFVNLAEQLWSKKEILSNELILMYEAFVVISNEWKDFNQQKQFLDYLLSPLINELNSNLYKEVMNSVPLLYQACGILNEENQEKKAKLEDIKSRIFHILTTITSLADRMPENPQDMGMVDPLSKQVKYPISTFILEVLPNILGLVRTIHMCYTVEGQNLVPQQVRKYILHIGIDEQYMARGDAFVQSKVSSEQYTIHRIHYYLTNLRRLCYLLIGQACKYCDKELFWANPSLFQMLTDSVFSFIEFIGIRDLSLMMLNFFQNFFENIPEELHNTLLLNILKPLLSLLASRIETAQAEICDKAGQTIGDEGVLDEIVKEKHLKELSSVVVNIILRATNSIRISKDNLKPKADVICTFIIGNSDLVGLIVMLFCKIIAVMLDPTSVVKCVMICDRIIRFMSNNQLGAYTNLFAGELFYSLLRSLMTTVDEQLQDSIISLTTFIYGCFRKKTNTMRDILTQVPTLTPQKVKHFDDAFGKANDEKDKKKKVKTLLSTICGMQKGAPSKSKSLLSLTGTNPIQQQSNDKKKGSKKPTSFLDNATVAELQGLF